MNFDTLSQNVELNRLYINRDTGDKVTVHGITHSSNSKILFDVTINRHRQTLTLTRKAVESILRRLKP